MKLNRRSYRLLLGVLLTCILAGAGFAATTAPYLIGLTSDSARVLLASHLGYSDPDKVSLRVYPDSFYTDSLIPGLIVWQEPAPDSVMEDGINIRLTAPLTIELPDIRGMPMLDAQALVLSMGLQFKTVGREENEEYEPGTVSQTHPEPGTPVQRGSQINAKISVRQITTTPILTSGGIEIHLYGKPPVKITSIAVESADSLGFVFSFAIQVNNPYKHSMEAEHFSCDLKVNDACLVSCEPEVSSIKIAPGGVANGKLKIPVSYSDISPALANILLNKARYRLVGTYALTVESGFSRKPFDSGEFEFDLTTKSTTVTEKLEGIVAPLEPEEMEAEGE